MCERCELTEDSICFSQGGLWISPAMDSGISGMVWDNAQIQFSAAKSDFFRFTVIASDKASISHNGEEKAVSDALAELIRGKSELLSDMSALTFINPRRIPLHRLRGRYLWFAAEFSPEKDSSFAVKSITAYYPDNSYMKALPSVFEKRDNGSLADLLALFRTITDETDAVISGFGDTLDPDAVTGKALERLLSWQGIGVTAIWSEDILRKVIRASARLTRLKGTETAITELFSILLGKAPVIVQDSKGFSFTVKVDYRSIRSGRHYAELLRLLKDFSPAGVSPRLELWRNGVSRIDDGLILSDDSFGSGFVI